MTKAMKEKQGRGQLTARVQNKAMLLMGRVITAVELRLMPYIQFAMVNEQRIQPDKISSEERTILSQWRKEGYLDGSVGDRMTISEEFWNIICTLIMLAYVDRD